jgi:hypothetical protein
MAKCEAAMQGSENRTGWCPKGMPLARGDDWVAPLLARAFGRGACPVKAASLLGIEPPQLDGMASGKVRVKRFHAVLLDLYAARREAGIALPDGKARRSGGYMDPHQFSDLAVRSFGRWWHAPAARLLGLTRGQMYRFASGESQIPFEVARVMSLVADEIGDGRRPSCLAGLCDGFETEPPLVVHPFVPASDLQEVRARARAVAVEAVLDVEFLAGNAATDVRCRGLGYDVLSDAPGEEGSVRIVVRERLPDDVTLALTADELRAAQLDPGRFVVAVVPVRDGAAGLPHYVRRAFPAVGDAHATSVDFDLAGLVGNGVPSFAYEEART